MLNKDDNETHKVYPNKTMKQNITLQNKNMTNLPNGLQFDENVQ